MNVRLSKKPDDIPDDPVAFVSSRLCVPAEVLMHPQGRKEKELRRKAITILENKHGFGVRYLARLFKMAPSSVFAILTEREINKGDENR